MKTYLTIIGLIAMGLAYNSASARVHAPRIVSEHNADAYSMKTFAQYPQWRNETGDQKAWQMFSYLTDYETGLYPMGSGAFEGPENLYEYNLVRDPVKLINVYSVGYCDVFGPVMAGIWQDGGHGNARVIDLPWNDHVTTEVFYNNNWHYLDLDLRAAFRRSDGSLASLADSKTEASLWDRTNGPRFFPLDYLPVVREAYEQSQLRYRYGAHQSGHTMDFVLRQGETFTRWWQPQGGRWLHHTNYENEAFIADIIESAPRGPKSKHESFSKYTHGNGQFVYSPDLTSLSSDFNDGVYDSNNIRTSTNGLTLIEPGTGYAVFEVRTPYVIVPLVGNRQTTSDDKQASVITLNATGATYSISVDNGITWQRVTGSTIDLTRQVAGKYGYLFKVELTGTPENTILRGLNMTTWVQLAPASLPSLRAGSNQMSFRSGDHYGLQTRVMELNPDTTDRTDLYKHIVVEPDSYNPTSDKNRLSGPFVMAVQAPPATKIVWFSAGASYQAYQLESAPLTQFSMAYATDVPFAFTEFYSAQTPTDMEHWHTNAQAEVRLDTPAQSVYLNYQGDPAVNTVQVYAHVIDDTPRTASAMNVTHRWLENGEVKTYNITGTSGNSYNIDVNSTPVNLSIEMSVDSETTGTSVPQVTPQSPPGNTGNEVSESSSTLAGTFTFPALVSLFALLVYRRGLLIRAQSNIGN